MLRSDDIFDIVYDCLEELNRQLPEGQRLARSADTVLVGKDGALDSLGLINFLVMLEDAVRSRLALRCTLVDEQRMAADDGPYRTVGTLVAFIARQG